MDTKRVVRELESRIPKGAIPVGRLRWRNQLRTARILCGVTQGELAERSGLHRKNVIDIEVHDREPSMRGRHQERLAEALGLPVGVLFYYVRE